MKKIAIYARVSTEQQIDNFSIPLQLERLHAFCKSKGWDNVEEYVDAGFTESNIDRPELTRLMRELPDISTVVVYKLDRLSRSQKDTLQLIEDFLKENVEFISLTETIDTSTPFGKAMLGILSVFAQLERETITERLRSGRYKMTKDLGFWSGGNDQHPTGYKRLKRGELEIDEEEAALVKRVFEEFIVLKSVTKIRNKFKEEGVPVWRYNRYFSVLDNRLYLGEVTFAGEIFKGSHTPIIDEDTFYRVQVIRSQNRGKNYGKIKDMFLSSKIICEDCGEMYRPYSQTNTVANLERVKYKYYICDRRRKPNKYGSKCLNKTWKKDVLEEHIFNLIENLTIKDFKGVKKQKTNYDKLIKNINVKIKRTLDLYIEANISKKQLDQKVIELNLEKQNFIMLKEEEKNSSKILKEMLDRRIDMRSANDDEKLAVVNTLIDKIYVSNDNIKVVWNI